MRRVFLSYVLCLSYFFPNAQTDTVSKVLQLSELSLETLMNLNVITATGYEQKISEAPSTMSVITAKQIEERGYEQLEDALRDIPGIDFIHINGYAPTLIYFRGMYGAENQRALLMIDGIVENNILGSNDIAGPAYSLHNVERIEVIWGPASALYGANAFGGVINIITKKGQEMNGLYAAKGYGTFNTSFDKVSMGIKKGKLEFALAGTLYSSDGPKFTNRDPEYAASYVDKAYSFNGSVTYYALKSKTTLGYRSYKTPMGWGTYSNSPTVYLGLPSQGNDNLGLVGVLARDIRGERSGLHDPFLKTLFIQNEYKPNEKLTLFSRLLYRETGSGQDSYIYVTIDGTKLIRAKIASYSNRASAEISANYSLSEKQRFSAGLAFYQDNVEQGARRSTFDTSVHLLDGRDTLINIYSTYLPRLSDIRNNFGSYLQYILTTGLLRKTYFTLGGRYDRNSYFGNAISPRIVVVNQPGEKLTFKLQFGKAFRAPGNLEIHQAQLNFALKKEKIITYEVNAIYSISNNLRAQLNLFRNELTDVIVLGNLSGLNPNKNPGVQKTNGAEASFDMLFTSKVSGFINLTYLDARGKNLVSQISGKVPGVASIKGNAGITTYIEDLFTVSLTGNFVGQRQAPRTDPYGPVSGYFLANCVINTGKLFNEKVRASINVRNLFNSKWLDPGFRTADGLLYSTVLEQPGRSVVFKVSLNLF